MDSQCAPVRPPHEGSLGPLARHAGAVAPALGTAWIGTSGWTYERWRRDFYAGVPRDQWLRWCTRQFTGLEINGTHYRLQAPATFERWRAVAPDGFRFAIKAHRYLTHAGLLLDPAGPVRVERDRADVLGSTLGAVLWQLPARLRRDDARLETFAETLVAEWPVRHAIEFRDPSWFQPGVADILRRHGIATCVSHSGTWPMWDVVTAGFVYVRLHGAPRTYASAYGASDLVPWVERVGAWLRAGLDVHVYFDNDADGAAPHDAVRLLSLLEHAHPTDDRRPMSDAGHPALED